MNQEVGKCSAYNIASLEAHLQSIRAAVAVARINHAQCALLLRRLQFVVIMLSRLPDPTPTPQIMSVFLAADFLIQCMHCGGFWQKLLRRHFTCNALFDGVLQRISLVWHMHSTESWVGEMHAAVKADEVQSAKLFLQMIGTEELSDGPIATVIQQQQEQQREGARTNESTLSEEEVINAFRRHYLSGWKVPFEVLTPPSSEGGDGGKKIKKNSINMDSGDDVSAEFLNAHLMFTTERGYNYRGISVVLRQLDGKFVEMISPNTVMSFVQDMVCRTRWCHPNLVPFIGAFTEKLSRDANSEITPTLALGVIMEDVTHLVAQFINKSNTNDKHHNINNNNNKTNSNNNNNNGTPNMYRPLYTLRPMEGIKDVDATYRSLHDLLFIQRRRFTLMEAIEITLQVADALHYILMDEPQVPAETAAAWIEVSPSHILICPLMTQTKEMEEAQEEQMDRGREDVLWEWPSNNEPANPVSSDSYIQLPLPGTFAVMYAPPVYVEHGPFSRWKPHPHAASPVCYALTQLFIALVSNETPYRAFEQQEELAMCIFDNPALQTLNLTNDSDSESDNEDNLPAVRVSIPIGCSIPSFLPLEIRNLCKRGLLLRNPQQVQMQQTENGLTLEQFRETMMSLYVNNTQLSYPEDTETEEQYYYRQCYSLSDDNRAGESFRRDQHGPVHSVEMMPPKKPLNDYGEFFSTV